MADNSQENDTADVLAVCSIITLVLLGTIHFIYTGGLPAFFDLLF